MSKRTCPDCGRKLTLLDKFFCTNCGCKLPGSLVVNNISQGNSNE